MVLICLNLLVKTNGIPKGIKRNGPYQPRHHPADNDYLYFYCQIALPLCQNATVAIPVISLAGNNRPDPLLSDLSFGFGQFQYAVFLRPPLPQSVAL